MDYIPYIIAIAVIIALFFVIWVIMKNEKACTAVRNVVDGKNNITHLARKKHRARFMAVLGAILIVIVVFASFCLGPTGCLSPVEAIQALISAISKGGQNLEGNEILVYSSRLPRTIAAVGAGIGLSIAGAVYQAIIRNPLVDPYIMGVSSGAGTAAIAVIAFQFTFFGLFSASSLYLTAVAAIVGGLLAFFCTMLVAEKAGGTTNSYVLAGVVIGLVFSAVQTVMMIFAGNHLSNAMLWLFGSFANITWAKAALVFIPCVGIALLCTKWAKELNLVLLGSDQARQMGLDAHKFSRFMLIIASVLTAFCVAFCGIIGFVGLVVPHLCRMIFGGDHRLVMPASMMFGGILMVAADVASRMIAPGYELPVGAITTLIGVPVFAYLLIKKGKMYNG